MFHLFTLRFGCHILLPCFLLVLSACTSLDSRTTANTPQLSHIPTHWTANGRLSVIRGEENWYARFNWVQEGDDFRIRFTGPLGETRLQVSQIGRQVRLNTSSVAKQGQDLEQLILQETGWVFPVASLRYWLYGQPKPEIAAKIQYNDAAQIKTLQQQGWTIQYSRWMPVEQQLLPKKMIVTRADLKIKLIISQWLLAEQALPL